MPSNDGYCAPRNIPRDVFNTEDRVISLHGNMATTDAPHLFNKHSRAKWVEIKFWRGGISWIV